MLSFGYGVLQQGLRDEISLSATVLLAIAAGKILTTSLTIGSGGFGRCLRPVDGDRRLCRRQPGRLRSRPLAVGSASSGAS